MFRYTDARKVQPVGVEIVVRRKAAFEAAVVREIVVRRTGAEAAYYELQVIVGGDWHETIVVDMEALDGALVGD